MKRFNLCILSGFLAASVASGATVALYEFDGSGTAAVGSGITDSVGGHHGTVEGGALLYGMDPIVGSYLRFDADGGVGGLGNRVVIPGHSDFLFNSTQGYTIEAIFRTTQTGTGTNGVIFSKGADVSNPDSQWWVRHQGTGQLRGTIEGAPSGVEDIATSTTATSSTLVNDGAWHSVALVYDGVSATKSLSLYIDGIFRIADTTIGTSGVIGGADTDPVVFGEFYSLVGNRSFAGDIAAVRFSNVALPAGGLMVVPEPSSLVLAFIAGVLALAGRREIRSR